MEYELKTKRRMRMKLPYAKCSSVEQYFALPKSEREKYGLYLKPYALPYESLFEGPEGDKGWDAWSKRIREEYPIQGFVREWLLTYHNPVYSFFDSMRYRYYDVRRAVRHFFKPALPRWRACLPRHKSADAAEMIVRSNFALIQDFYHEEMSKGMVDYSDNRHSRAFDKYIKNAIQWIEHDRQKTIEALDAAYDVIEQKRLKRKKGDRPEPYEELYRDVHALEKLLEKTDTKILNNMVKYRGHCWI